ncbi:MAG: cupredoxin domain-containing protein [Actinomycetes bacterium]
MSTAAAHTTSGRPHRAVAAHTRTEVLGLSLIAGANTLVLVVGLSTGIPLSDASFLFAPLLAAAGGAALAWSTGTWGRAVALVLGLGAATMTFWLGFGILAPMSFVEFTSGTAFLLGVGLLLWGGIASLVRRNDIRTGPTRSETMLDRTALAVVGLALLVSLPLWALSRSTVDATTTAGMPVVAVQNFAFEDLTVTSSDGAVSLVVRNRDAFGHTFTIDELGVDVALLPGSAEVVTFDAAPGTYTYYCIPHSAEAGAGEDDMAATLTIE